MEDCIFCKIINKEIPSKIVYEDEEILAFKDINPIAPVHILIIPKKHLKSVLELQEVDKNLIGKIYLVINDLAKKENIDKEGFRIVVNCGENGGQEVQHLHFHLIGGRKLKTEIC